MSAYLSFCNDCDLMTRRGFEEIHAFLESIKLPSGDSFWLFDPSGGDMGLFTHDVDHPGPHHAWLLDQISAGVLDVIHSAGSYGERFNRGYRPNRGQIEKALKYLDRHAVIPRIWTNHGDVFNTQNIGGAIPAPHHLGDLPGSDTYCLDLLRDFGVEYFWLDRLVWRSPELPYRVLAREKCRDGSEISTFLRYLSIGVDWSPNGQNFDHQLQLHELRKLSENNQDMVLYTHWGCHHEGRTAVTPDGDCLTTESRQALSNLAQQLSALDLHVVRLNALLDANRKKQIQQETQRIGEIVVRPEKDKPDSFYYNQYAKHGIGYFSRRLKGMGVSGKRALDAGCGVGQWSYALSEFFGEVHGIEMNSDALKYLDQMTAGLRLPSGPRFASGSIESLPYEDEYFDFILCYGVLFCTSFRRTLHEFSRVLAPGGRAYICINGDGWYEYLVDERFRDKPNEFALPFVEPIWNALVARIGGEANLINIFGRDFCFDNPSFWSDPAEIRKAFVELISPTSIVQSTLVSQYSDRIIMLLATLTQSYFAKIQHAPKRRWIGSLLSKFRMQERPTHSNDQTTIYLPLDGIGSRNRAVMPDEFADMAKLFGMRMTEFASDGGLSKDLQNPPIYAPAFNGHNSVWECYLVKD